MPIFKSFPEIEISPNYEIAYFGNVRLELVFASFLSFFACFRLWVLYKVNYCLPVRVGGRIFFHPVDVDEFNLEQNLELVWI